MRYRHTNKLENTGSQIGTSNIYELPVVNQNIQGDRKLCGLYVLINAILITEMAKYADTNKQKEIYEIMTEPNPSAKFKIVKDNMKAILERYNMNNKSDDNINLLFADNTGITLDPNRTDGKFAEVNGLTNILINTDGSFYYEPLNYISPPTAPPQTNIYFNIELITQNVIILQDTLNEKFRPNTNFDDYCNKILLDNDNLIKMKPFFSLDNYIMTFIVSVNVNVGHWVCYTINKFRDADGIKKQIIFMDSIGGSHNPDRKSTV